MHKTYFDQILELHKNNISNALSDLKNHLISNIAVDKWEDCATEINLKNLGIDRNYQNEILNAVNAKFPNEYEIVNDILRDKEG
jgi:hypothetical protein